MPALTAGLLPVLGVLSRLGAPGGGAPSSSRWLWGLDRSMLTSHRDLEMGQMVALTQGACPEN